MTPLKITARLVNGFVAADPWSPSIDGILACAVMRERLGDDYTYQAAQPSKMVPVEGLPLERVEYNDMWWYAASSPIYDVAIKEQPHFHRRFDDRYAIDLLPQIKKVGTSAGSFKNCRLRETRLVAPTIVWHAIGDEREVRRLLATIPAVGAARGRGRGEVAGWLVSPDGDERLARVSRPLPVAYANAQGVSGLVMLAGIRPPARLPCNMMECVMPEARHA
jgi:CRISPR type IV-associated protein Csf3